jgi:hypothetical protein
MGPTNLGPEIGLWIGAGASGEVKRNTITDYLFTDTAKKNPASSTAPTFPSIGIVGLDIRYYFYELSMPAALQTVVFEENTFSNNELHMALFKANGSQIINNAFAGAGPTYRPTGLILSGSNALVASNRFSAIPTGITLLGNDPDWKTLLGVAANPRLVANRFCDVTLPMEKQSLVSGVTEQDTLVCPFPDPTLTIAPAVILAWPAYTEGWILESAPAANGPWTASTGSATVQDGQNTVTVNADAQGRFFRLRHQ